MTELGFKLVTGRCFLVQRLLCVWSVPSSELGAVDGLQCGVYFQDIHGTSVCWSRWEHSNAMEPSMHGQWSELICRVRQWLGRDSYQPFISAAL